MEPFNYGSGFLYSKGGGGRVCFVAAALLNEAQRRQTQVMRRGSSLECTRSSQL